MMMDKVELIEKAVIDRGGELPPVGMPPKSGYWYSAGILYKDGAVVCTKSEFMEARKLLENKPVWDDAPEWAEWLGLWEDQWIWYPVKPKEGSLGFVINVGEQKRRAARSGNYTQVRTDWRQSLEPRPSSHPMSNEHHDHKEGEGVKWEPGVDFPPVGWHGECTWGEKVNWLECVMLPDELMAAKNYGQWEVRHLRTNYEFRPIQSHRDKVIEASIPLIKGRCWSSDIAETLYDAGMLKLPGEEALSGTDKYRQRLVDALNKAVSVNAEYDNDTGEMKPGQEDWIKEAEALIIEIEEASDD